LCRIAAVALVVPVPLLDQAGPGGVSTAEPKKSRKIPSLVGGDWNMNGIFLYVFLFFWGNKKHTPN